MFSIPQTGFYVYTLADSNDIVFYVGKGQGRRISDHETEARRDCPCHKCRKIRKIWRNGGQIKRAIVFVSNDEAATYRYEAQLIAQYGIRNLTNYRESDQRLKTCYKLPDKPFHHFTDSEYKAYLNSLRNISKASYQKRLYNWRCESIAALRKEWGKCRRKHQHDRADEITKRIEEIEIQLGWVRQETLDF